MFIFCLFPPLAIGMRIHMILKICASEMGLFVSRNRAEVKFNPARNYRSISRILTTCVQGVGL